MSYCLENTRRHTTRQWTPDIDSALDHEPRHDDNCPGRSLGEGTTAPHHDTDTRGAAWHDTMQLLITSYTRDTHTLNDQLHQCIALPETMHYEATRSCKTKGRWFKTHQKERGCKPSRGHCHKTKKTRTRTRSEGSPVANPDESKRRSLPTLGSPIQCNAIIGFHSREDAKP